MISGGLLFSVIFELLDASLDAGTDIATASKMASHASVNVTARYDLRGEIAKQKAALSLRVPFWEANILHATTFNPCTSEIKSDPDRRQDIGFRRCFGPLCATLFRTSR
jgi:hypothetical protein